MKCPQYSCLVVDTHNIKVPIPSKVFERAVAGPISFPRVGGGEVRTRISHG